MSDYRTTVKTTLELKRGDRVQLPYGGPVRTILSRILQPLKSISGANLYSILYVEGATPEWGPANWVTDATRWTVIEPC